MRAIDAALKRRLQILFDADIALAAYHLPLDAHPSSATTRCSPRALGGGRARAVRAATTAQPIGFIASFPATACPREELFARVHERHRPRAAACSTSGRRACERLAIVSGAGADYIAEAAAAGAEALLTGELGRALDGATPARPAMHLIAAGHYATETFGVRRLGEHLAERFALRHVFLDVPNPV